MINNELHFTYHNICWVNIKFKGKVYFECSTMDMKDRPKIYGLIIHDAYLDKLPINEQLQFWGYYKQFNNFVLKLNFLYGKYGVNDVNKVLYEMYKNSKKLSVNLFMGWIIKRLRIDGTATANDVLLHQTMFMSDWKAPRIIVLRTKRLNEEPPRNQYLQRVMMIAENKKEENKEKGE